MSGGEPDSRLAVDVASETGRLPVSRRAVGDAARAVLRGERVSHALLSVSFVTRRAIAALNRKHLGHRGPTDVITFALGRAGAHGPVVGDVYVCPDVARENARRLKVPVREELLRLVVHGLLHALGYEHPEGAERTGSALWKKQERYVARLARGAA